MCAILSCNLSMPATDSSIHVATAPGNSGVIRKTVQPNSKFPVTSFLFFMHALCAHAQIYSKYKTDCPVLSWNVSIAIDRLSSIKWGLGYRQRILGVVTYVLVVARTGTPTVPTAPRVPYGYAPAVTRVLGPTIAMSVTILKL